MFDFNTFGILTPYFSILIPAFDQFFCCFTGQSRAGSLKQDWRQPGGVASV